MEIDRSRQGKEKAIASVFKSIVGLRLSGYEYAELYVEHDGEWSRWDDLPIRLFFEDERAVSVSWSEFDDLTVNPNTALPTWLSDDMQIRWVRNGISELNNLIEQRLTVIELGRGEMTINGSDIEIWTRLLMEFETGWLEIFNALDGNGYEVHFKHPEGKFRLCA